MTILIFSWRVLICIIAISRLKQITNKDLRDFRLIAATTKSIIEGSEPSLIRDLALDWLGGKIDQIDRLLAAQVSFIGSVTK